MSSSIDEQMLREINVLKGLRCRHIIKVFESLIYGDRVIICYTYMYDWAAPQYCLGTAQPRIVN